MKKVEEGAGWTRGRSPGEEEEDMLDTEDLVLSQLQLLKPASCRLCVDV
jgi:hypothetical protein